MTNRTATYATLTNTNADVWLLKSRSGQVWGAVHADGLDAAFAAANSRIATRLPAGVRVGDLTPVKTSTGCYSLRRIV